MGSFPYCLDYQSPQDGNQTYMWSLVIDIQLLKNSHRENDIISHLNFGIGLSRFL